MARCSWILLRMRNVLYKFLEKIKTHILYAVTFFRKLYRLCDNVEKCGGTRGTTNDVTIWCVRVECWISKATRVHAYAYVHAPGHQHARTHACNTPFPRQQWFVKVPQFHALCLHCLSCFSCLKYRQKNSRFEIKVSSWLLRRGNW